MADITLFLYHCYYHHDTIPISFQCQTLGVNNEGANTRNSSSDFFTARTDISPHILVDHLFYTFSNTNASFQLTSFIVCPSAYDDTHLRTIRR